MDDHRDSVPDLDAYTHLDRHTAAHRHADPDSDGDSSPNPYSDCHRDQHGCSAGNFDFDTGGNLHGTTHEH
jgi:hypothetical protein